MDRALGVRIVIIQKLTSEMRAAGSKAASQLMPYLVRERSGTFSQGRNFEKNGKNGVKLSKIEGMRQTEDPFEVKTV